MRVFHVMTAFVVLILLTRTLEAQSTLTPGTRPSERNADKSPIIFSELVRSLKNCNAEPKIKGGWEVVFDDSYEFGEQRRIFKAIKTLQIYSEEAWPELASQLGNKEYSFTFGFGGSSVNYSVGDVCEQIIRNNLAASYLGFNQLLEGMSIPASRLDNPRTSNTNDLKKWLKDRQGKSLLDLQIETLQNLAERVTTWDIADETRKTLLIAIESRTSFLKRKRVPEPASKFIPNRETWWYLTREDAER